MRTIGTFLAQQRRWATLSKMIIASWELWMNTNSCPENQRLLKAYDHAFRRWGGHNGASESTGTIDSAQQLVEDTYRDLTDHQQSCAKCSAELSQGKPSTN